MSVVATAAAGGGGVVIRVRGRFDFSTHQEFRSAYENAAPGTRDFEVDLKEATYLDSSALGMLLLLRDHAGGDHAQIRITHCNPDVRKILTISNFEELFAIQ